MKLFVVDLDRGCAKFRKKNFVADSNFDRNWLPFRIFGARPNSNNLGLIVLRQIAVGQKDTSRCLRWHDVRNVAKSRLTCVFGRSFLTRTRSAIGISLDTSDCNTTNSCGASTRKDVPPCVLMKRETVCAGSMMFSEGDVGEYGFLLCGEGNYRRGSFHGLGFRTHATKAIAAMRAGYLRLAQD